MLPSYLMPPYVSIITVRKIFCSLDDGSIATVLMHYSIEAVPRAINKLTRVINIFKHIIISVCLN